MLTALVVAADSKAAATRCVRPSPPPGDRGFGFSLRRGEAYDPGKAGVQAAKSSAELGAVSKGRGKGEGRDLARSAVAVGRR